MPPVADHADFTSDSLVKDLLTRKGEVKFGHPQLRYNCHKGYTLDGSPPTLATSKLHTGEAVAIPLGTRLRAISTKGELPPSRELTVVGG